MNLRHLLLIPFVLLVLVACDERRTSAVASTGGDPDAGRLAIDRYGCAGCHTIPGVGEAALPIGPSLAGMKTRSSIARTAEHTPENLILYIRHPQDLVRTTSMPDLGVGEQEARDIAAYLYTLR